MRHHPRTWRAAVLVSAILALTVATPAGADPDAPGAAPTVSALTPDRGPGAGGTVVTITGSGFTGATGVRFGSTTAATSFTVVSDTEITATSPPAPTPPDPILTANVIVDTPEGSSATGSSSWFQWRVPPRVVGVHAGGSSFEGGWPLVLEVEDLYHAGRRVLVDGQQVGFAVVVSGGAPALRVTMPSRAPGTALVVVEAGNGAADPVPVTYTSTPRPRVTAIDPATGPVGGGTSVTIDGADLTGATAVTFLGRAGQRWEATDVAVVDPGQLTAVTPAATLGVAGVEVRTPAGPSPTSTATYSFAGPPVITSVSPATGPTAGGGVVSIHGVDLHRVTGVSFGGVPATSWTHRPFFGRIDATAPPHAAGPVDVRVDSAEGTSVPSSGSTYTYEGTNPVITSLGPPFGPPAGGTVVTITGAGFTGATGVRFGAGRPAASFTVVSDTEITATSPPGPAETVVNLFVDTPTGTNPPSAAGWFRFGSHPRPGLVSVSPNAGPVAGGTAVTIAGVNLSDVTAVRFGPAGPAAFTIDSPTQITAVAPPAGGPWLVNVVLDAPAGTSATSMRSWYRYTT